MTESIEPTDKIVDDIVNNSSDEVTINYAQICDILPQGIVVQDTNGQIIYSNTSAEAILGLTADQLAGRMSIDPRWHSVYPDGSPFPGEKHPIMVTLQTGEAQQNVMMGVHKPNGYLTWISVDSRPLVDESQQLTGAIAVFLDMTHIQRMQEEDAVEQRLEKERTKLLSDFVRDASHEFRTPLATIHTKLYLMKRRNPDLAESQDIKDINSYLEAIDTLVDKMEFLLKLDEVKGWTISPVNVKSAIDSIVYNYQHQYDGNILIEYQDPTSKIFANEELVITAISQIIDNAIGFSPDDGDIIVRVSDKGHYIHIDVIDHGIGMSEDVLSRVYEHFFRLDEARTRRGFGLGLPIVQRIMAIHTNQLQITSMPNEGTKVSMKFVNIRAIGK